MMNIVLAIVLWAYISIAHSADSTYDLGGVIDCPSTAYYPGSVCWHIKEPVEKKMEKKNEAAYEIDYPRPSTDNWIGIDYPRPSMVREESAEKRIKRDRAVVRQFLRSLGRTTTPKGAQVDHIFPLSCGGPDTAENLQLIWGDYKDRKEAAERECETIGDWIHDNPCSSGECVKPKRE